MMDRRKLTAAPEMVLTNGETYSTEVYLGCNDKPENWYEITEAEYNEIMKKQEDFLGGCIIRG